MTSCYRQYNGNTISTVGGFVPCANYKSTTGFSTCCAGGQECLEDGFCYNSDSGAGQSGYYMAICTDPTYKDASCPQHCIDLYKGDVVYNTNTNLWSCCGQVNNSDSSSQVSCNNPTSETFQDLSPAQLQSAATASTSSTTTSSSSSSSSSTSSSSTSSSSTTPATSTTSSSSTASATSGTLINNTVNNGLSSGAKAGIGVGVALGVLVLLGLILFFFMRSRRARRGTQTAEPQNQIQSGTAVVEKRPEMDAGPAQSYSEMDGGKYGSPAPPYPVQEMGDENRR